MPWVKGFIERWSRKSNAPKELNWIDGINIAIKGNAIQRFEDRFIKWLADAFSSKKSTAYITFFYICLYTIELYKTTRTLLNILEYVHDLEKAFSQPNLAAVGIFRRRLRERHIKISKNKSSARPTRAFYILIHFFAVISQMTTWNDQIQGSVEDVSTWRVVFVSLATGGLIRDLNRDPFH